MNTIAKVQKIANSVNADSIQVYECLENIDFKIASFLSKDIPTIEAHKDLSNFNNLKRCKAKEANFEIAFINENKGIVKMLYLKSER